MNTQSIIIKSLFLYYRIKTEIGSLLECHACPVRDLDDDYYEFDEKNYCLRGRRKNKIYSLGDAITVRVARANLEKKQLDFELIEK